MRTPPCDCQDSTELSHWPDRTDPLLWNDSRDPIDIAEPVEPSEANDPMLPTEATEPMLPTDRTDPSEAIERIELRERMDHSDRSGMTSSCPRCAAGGRGRGEGHHRCAPGGEGEVGGLNPEGRPGPGGALVLLCSDDLEATVAGVREAGRVISREPYAFPGGRRFIFRDPAGNELGVWTTA